jgi:hypothetical protein
MAREGVLQPLSSHYPVLILFVAALGAAGAALAAIPIAFWVAWIVWRTVERPSIALSRRVGALIWFAGGKWPSWSVRNCIVAIERASPRTVVSAPSRRRRRIVPWAGRESSLQRRMPPDYCDRKQNPARDPA